jgi:hypothetical protein
MVGRVIPATQEVEMRSRFVASLGTIPTSTNKTGIMLYMPGVIVYMPAVPATGRHT